MNQAKQLEVGEIIADKYRVLRCIGRGGMSVVVEALHIHLGQRVALKLVTAPPSDKRRLDEARTAASLASEHAVRVFDCGMHGNIPYLVMEQLEGCDLKTHLAAVKAEAVPEAAAMILQVCEAIGEAHARGIVHSDLKPSNLFVSRRVDGSRCMKVLDFGIARTTDSSVGASSTIAGSPGYAAPEQLIAGGRIDARTDVWALGVVLYRLVSGEMPFAGKDFDKALLHALTTNPRPLVAAKGDLPQGFTDVVMRCLEKDPEDRFANVGELALALSQFAPVEDHSYVKRTWCVLSASNEHPIAVEEVVDEAKWTGAPSEISLETDAPVVDATFSGEDVLDGKPALVGELVPARPRGSILTTVLAAAMIVGLLFLARSHLPASRGTFVRSAAAATQAPPPVAATPAAPSAATAAFTPSTTAPAQSAPMTPPTTTVTVSKPASSTAKAANKARSAISKRK